MSSQEISAPLQPGPMTVLASDDRPVASAPRPRRRPALVLRLTLLFALVSGVVLLGIGWLVARAIESHFIDLDRDTLVSKVHLVHNSISDARGESIKDRLLGLLPLTFSGHHDLYARVLGPDGAIWFAAEGLQFPDEIRYANHGEESVFEWRDGTKHFRGVAVQFPLDGREGMAKLAIAIDTAHHEFFMEDFRAKLSLYVFGAALVAGFLGWLAARSGLAPLKAMRARAASITSNRLNERMPVDTVPEEMAELATELNAMLSRLEDAFRRLSQFSSDLAHELRTPLSNLLTQTEVSLSRPRDAATYQEILASNAEELQRLARMVSDMLYLAKAENGLTLPTREPIDLSNEVRALFEYFEAFAEERGVALRCSCEKSEVVHGDSLMLRRAISNLLANALRYTHRGGEIDVSIRSVEGNVVLEVANPGDPIDPDRLPHLYKRFYRADQSRHHSEAEGAGLGLSITRAIVAAHGGSVGAASQNGVNRFFLRLPLLASKVAHG